MANPEGRRAVNLWKPILRIGTVKQTKVDVFLEHIRWLFGDRADEFLDWLAHIEQQPGVLPHTVWLHIATNTGLGRNWIAGVLAKVWIGYVAPNVDLVAILSDGFTDELSMKLLAQVDELREGGGERWDHAERMKSLFNCEFRNVNRKGVPKFKEHNFVRWLLFSNHLDAIPIQDNDRRVQVVVCECGPKDPQYYRDLYALTEDSDFINSLGLWFRQRDITGFNPGDGAKKDDDRRKVLSSLKSDDRRVLEHIVESWPSDLITNETLASQLNGSNGYSAAKLSRAQAEQEQKL